MIDQPLRQFTVKRSRSSHRVKWLKPGRILEGRLLSMTNRTVRLFAPDPWDPKTYVDVPYDWLIPTPRSAVAAAVAPVAPVALPDHPALQVVDLRDEVNGK